MPGLDTDFVTSLEKMCKDSNGTFHTQKGAYGVEVAICEIPSNNAIVRIKASGYQKPDEDYVEVQYVTTPNNDVDLSIYDYFSTCNIQKTSSYSRGTRGYIMHCTGTHGKDIELRVEDNGRLVSIIGASTVSGHIYTK